MTTEAAIEFLEKKYAGAEDVLVLLSIAQQRDRLEPWHWQVFAGLLISATSAQKHLRLGFEHRDISHVCWAARTLLELFVWADFCRADKENARRFYQDAMRDLNGTMVTFQQLLDVIDVTPEQRMMIDDTQEGSEDLSVRGGLAPQNTKFTQVADAADKIGRGPWFRKANKILSKLVHPTAFAVVTAPTDGLSGGACEHLFMTGLYYALYVYDSINLFAKPLDTQELPIA
jgi:hypothetical protein